MCLNLFIISCNYYAEHWKNYRVAVVEGYFASKKQRFKKIYAPNFMFSFGEYEDLNLNLLTHPKSAQIRIGDS